MKYLSVCSGIEAATAAWQHEKRTHEIENAIVTEPPIFPEQPFAELLGQAFLKTMIDTPDHPAFR